MNRRGVCLGAAAIALTVPLAGCMTVHGERENIPSASKKEAASAVARFLAVTNEVSRDYDAKKVLTVEAGVLGATDEAGLRSRHAVDPDGDPGYEPLAFSDTEYLIPRQVGWPKYFVADTATNRDPVSRWLLVFRHAAPGQPWKAVYVAAVTTSAMPEFAKDEDGHAVAAGMAGTDLLVQPGKLSEAYTGYLGKGGGDFADGPATSQLRSTRQANAKGPNSVTQYADQPASGGDYAPAALRTADGGAVVFFAARLQSRSTFRAGYSLNLSAGTKALLTGTPRTSITLSQVADCAATVPAAGGSGKVVLLSRIVGLVSAKGA
jgi:hypothetical protein